MTIICGSLFAILYNNGMLSVRLMDVCCVNSYARPTGDKEIVGSILAGSGNILWRRLILKYFLR